MGNQLGIGQTASSLHDLPLIISELSPSLQFGRSLGGGKVLKTVECNLGQALVVVKIHIRRDSSLSLLKSYPTELERILTRLQSSPCLLPYSSWHVSPRAVFLVRPFIAINLHDRFHMRPFLSETEKIWIIYCVLRALKTLHEAEICHSDLKTENILLNSFQWVIVSDINSFFKPALLPDDNPYDFHTFFESRRDQSLRKRCYVAPERFFSPSSSPAYTGETLRPAMDMFSFGCVAAEVFLEGEALFDLPHLLSFKDGRFDPEPTIQKISFAPVHDLVRQCIKLDPEKRPSAAQCLKDFEGSLFPESFTKIYDVLNDVMCDNTKSLDSRLQIVRDQFTSLMEHISDIPRARKLMKRSPLRSPLVPAGEPSPSSHITSSTVTPTYSDITELFSLLKTDSSNDFDDEAAGGNSSDGYTDQRDDDFDNAETDAQPQISNESMAETALPLVMFVCSCIRNLSQAESKIMALDMLLSLAYSSSDSIRLNRILPYIIACLSDPGPLIRAEAISVLTKILVLVQCITVADRHIWADYIFPSLSAIPNDPEEIVRISLAQNIARLADSSRRFLDSVRFVSEETDIASESPTTPFDSYESELDVLRNAVCRLVGDTLATSGSCVKIAMLSDISRLGVFLGRDRCNSWLLPMLITVLNDRDWQLRNAFFKNVIGVSVFVGRIAFQNFLLPCIEQALFDVEETVIVSALQALIAQVKIGLFEHCVVISVTSRIVPLLCHPSAWIRIHALKFCSTVSEQLGPAKTYCLLGPCIKPFLLSESRVYSSTKDTLSYSLRPPLKMSMFTSRAVPEEDDDQRHVLSAMTPYIEGVNAARLQKIQSKQASGDKTDADILQRYVQLWLEFPVFAVTVEHTVPNVYKQSIVVEASATVPDLGRHSLSLDSTVAAEACESIYSSNGNAIFSDTQLWSQSTETMPKMTDIFQKVISKSSRIAPHPNIRYSAHEIPSHIYSSLDVPGKMCDLGSCNTVSLSSSWVYGNSSPPYDRRMALHPHSWRPQGILVAELLDHRSAVTQIAVSRDNQFICSGSLDGTVRIWDCQRLEKSVSASSQYIYHASDDGVSSVTLCDASHSVVVGTASGSVHLVRVDRTIKKDGSTERYSGISPIAKVDVKLGAVTSVQHCNRISESMIIYSTEEGVVKGWDLRSNRDSFQMRIPLHHGSLSHMQLGPSIHSLVTGSSRGFVSLFDIRLHIPVQSWRHSTHHPISYLKTTPVTNVTSSSVRISSSESGPLMFIGTYYNNNLTAFDLNTGEAKACFMSDPHNRDVPHLEPDVCNFQELIAELNRWPSERLGNLGISGVLHCPGSWVITSSWNRKITFWDVVEPSASYTISGGQQIASYSDKKIPGLDLFEDSPQPLEMDQVKLRRRGPVPVDRSHVDVISSMAAVQLPQKMLITGSRDGRIKVWV